MGLKQGDILCGFVGYGMTIYEFYRIVKRTPKTVLCEEMRKEIVSTDMFGQSGFETCSDKPVGGMPIRAKVRQADGEDLVLIGGRSFRLWDGRAVSFDYCD